VTRPVRIVALAALVVILAGATTAYAVRDHGSGGPAHSGSGAGPTGTDGSTGPVGAPLEGPRIVFRNTGLDDRYGQVAMVPLSDPGGPRTFTGVACDRVYATATEESCLRAGQGGASGSDLVQLNRSWQVVATDPVPGLPSRTRISPDGSLVASTTFVSGHAYMQIGFSTETIVRHFDGTGYGNLESFRLIIDGHTVKPEDRNVWGVTFARDDDTFYATVGTDGSTYLVKGSLSARTLTAIHTNAECPSLSPDGTHVAYKVDIGNGQKWWTPAVLDLETGVQTLLGGERRNIDDQVEWLDGHTLLYGVPRTDEAGVDDIWALRTTPWAKPRLLIKNAWSPAVIR
jgi:hypothetical protein